MLIVAPIIKTHYNIQTRNLVLQSDDAILFLLEMFHSEMKLVVNMVVVVTVAVVTGIGIQRKPRKLMIMLIKVSLHYNIQTRKLIRRSDNTISFPLEMSHIEIMMVEITIIIVAIVTGVIIRGTDQTTSVGIIIVSVIQIMTIVDEGI
jgi:hypothetical protein